MRYVNSDPASGNVYLWSPAPVSVPPGYHKIWDWVKRNAPTATSWGWNDQHGIAEKTKGKLSHQFCRSLHYNDNREISRKRTR